MSDDKSLLNEIRARIMGSQHKEITMRRVARILGAAAGSMLPKIDASKMDTDDELSREFLAGLEDGKLARNLGDVLIAGARSTPSTEEDEQT